MDKWETWEPGGGGGKEAWVDRALECMWTTGSPPPKDTHVISQPGSSIAIHRAKGRSATCLRLLAAGSSQSPASLPHPEGRAVSPDPDRARTNLHNVHRRAHRFRSAPTAPNRAHIDRPVPPCTGNLPWVLSAVPHKKPRVPCSMCSGSSLTCARRNKPCIARPDKDLTLN